MTSALLLFALLVVTIATFTISRLRKAPGDAQSQYREAPLEDMDLATAPPFLVAALNRVKDYARESSFKISSYHIGGRRVFTLRSSMGNTLCKIEQNLWVDARGRKMVLCTVHDITMMGEVKKGLRWYKNRVGADNFHINKAFA